MEFAPCKNVKFRCAVCRNTIMNDEIRIPNDEINPNEQSRRLGSMHRKARIRHSELCHAFLIRHWPFVISHSYEIAILAVVLLSSTGFTEEKKEEKSPMNSSNEVAVIKTSQGDMVMQFWSDAAPNTIENFKKLARQGFY